MAELKFKMVQCELFLDTFNFRSDTRGHFSNVNTWSKNAPQICERRSSNKVIEGNVQELSNFKA